MKHFALTVPLNSRFSDAILKREGLESKQSCDEVSVKHLGFDDLIFVAVDQAKSRKVFILGSVLEGGTVDTQSAAMRLAAADDPDAVVAAFNGEFLAVVVDFEEVNVAVYTDRFASYPFYWASNGDQLVGSYIYTDLARYCCSWDGFQLRAEKAFEFFYLQRLMGTETHDTLSKFLPAASKLFQDAAGNLCCRFYGQRGFDKFDNVSTDDLSSRFVGLIDEAVKSRLPKDDKYGVFLSGGHDSRLVAAYADSRAQCYTLGFSDNLEVSCARKISKELGQKHHFVKLPQDHFLQILSDAGYLSGAMYAVDHSLFVPTACLKQLDSNVILHGHALDYMFQGMYLNASPVKFFGRNTFLKKFKKFPEDIARYFLQNASFKLKYNFAEKYGKSNQVIDFLSDRLYRTVNKLVDEAKEFEYSSADIWEYLYFHQPSRHYTFSNVLSKRLHGEIRTPSFDANLYCFYRGLRGSDRLYAQMSRAAMSRHPSKIGQIPAGNYGLPAAWGPVQKTAGLFFRKVMKEITGNPAYAVPGADARTWPNRTDYLQSDEGYFSEVRAAVDYCAKCDVLDFLDWDAVRADLEELKMSNGGASFLVSALTYALFHKNVYG
ncbi:asparagine synthase-related protein [Thalassospira sp. MIT1370]|uniref:asparagine synthase-related protein n=1 Tax=unclassified Thalassospira TaxID=2648997 RepID=UPI00399B768A